MTTSETSYAGQLRAHGYPEVLVSQVELAENYAKVAAQGDTTDPAVAASLSAAHSNLALVVMVATFHGKLAPQLEGLIGKLNGVFPGLPQ